MLAFGCPSLYPDEEYRRRFANELRVGASPAVAYALNRALAETDLREVLPAVRVPTLVLYRRIREVEEDALDVADRIPSARAMRVSGDDYFGLFLSLDIADEIERFVAGEEAPEIPASVLATVMFTDLVGSTERAASLGDRGWRELPAAHHALGASCHASEARNAIRPATASSRPSTAPRGRSAPATRSSQASGISASNYASASTSASASCTMRSRRGSRSASARASRPRPGRGRCSSQVPSATSSPVLGSTSKSGATRNSRAFPEPGGSTRRARRFPDLPERAGLSLETCGLAGA